MLAGVRIRVNRFRTPLEGKPEDTAYKRICDPYAQCKSHESILDVVPGLNSVIPLVEHLDCRTHKASEQDKCDGYNGRPRSHPAKCITSQSSEPMKADPLR